MSPEKVLVTVESTLKGNCGQGFKPGDSWLIEDGKTPGGMCASAYYAAYPAIRTLRMGGEHPWDKDKNITHVACPDSEVVLIMELKRFP